MASAQAPLSRHRRPQRRPVRRRPLRLADGRSAQGAALPRFQRHSHRRLGPEPRLRHRARRSSSCSSPCASASAAQAPLFDTQPSTSPNTTGSTAAWSVGAALFGIGWGMSGICPGPAISLIAFLPDNLWIFLVAHVRRLLCRQRHRARAAASAAWRMRNERA